MPTLAFSSITLEVSRWSPEAMHVIDMSTVMSRVQWFSHMECQGLAQVLYWQRVGLLLRTVCVDSKTIASSSWMWLCLQKHQRYPSPECLPPETSPYGNLLPRLATHLLTQLYRVNLLAVQLYIVNSFLCSAEYNKPTSCSAVYNKPIHSFSAI